MPQCHWDKTRSKVEKRNFLQHAMLFADLRLCLRFRRGMSSFVAVTSLAEILSKSRLDVTVPVDVISRPNTFMAQYPSNSGESRVHTLLPLILYCIIPESTSPRRNRDRVGSVTPSCTTAIAKLALTYFALAKVCTQKEGFVPEWCVAVPETPQSQASASSCRVTGSPQKRTVKAEPYLIINIFFNGDVWGFGCQPARFPWTLPQLFRVLDMIGVAQIKDAARSAASGKRPDAQAKKSATKKEPSEKALSVLGPSGMNQHEEIIEHEQLPSNLCSVFTRCLF
eukprot:4873453-Amphidinium_carterae.2